ncbi:hypothetical protein ACGGZK_00855 [Agromyces sp. MMS24-K17]|uniref:hypothetical protein n=1 Tax=Agromyces sp. MMS24-K17 TaxID=3372850 RepID=UPI003754CBC8
MTLLRYIRSSGFRIPAEYETVEVDPDGRLAGWRSVSVGAVGSFEGRLGAADVADVRAAVDRALAAPPPGGPARPGSSSETVELDDGFAVSVEAAGDAGEASDAAWRAVRDLGRDLAERQLAFPVAAIALAGRDDRDDRLEFRGTHPLELDLSGAVVERYGVRADGTREGGAVALPGGGRVDASPGWTLPLPAADAAGPPRVQVVVRFGIVAGGRTVPVELASPAPD